MESTTATINQTTTEGRAIPMTRFSISEDDEDVVPNHIKRPRLSSESASQSRCVSTEEEDVESDSDGYEEVEPDEEDDGEEEAETDGEEEEEEEEEEVEFWEEVPNNNNQQQVMSSTAVINNNNNNNKNNVNGELQVVLTDPDVLDCPICLDPLCTPVFQCENGHIACSSCCSKVKRKCPSCCMPIGYNRCRAIEKVIESVKVSCKNVQYGCKMTVAYCKKSEHEQMCPYVTCFCPHPSCPFVSSSNKMYLHFGIQHAASATRFTYNTTFSVNVTAHQTPIFLQEQHESVIFILNHEVKEHGRALSVDCVGPSTLKSSFEYQITAKLLDSTLSLQCAPQIYTMWSEHPLKENYLMVPCEIYCVTRHAPLRLRICIKKVVSPVPV